MTLEELKNLKYQIDYNLDALHEKNLKAEAISNAINIIIDRDPTQSFINTWLSSIDIEIEAIVKALQELEEELLN